MILSGSILFLFRKCGTLSGDSEDGRGTCLVCLTVVGFSLDSRGFHWLVCYLSVTSLLQLVGDPGPWLSFHELLGNPKSWWHMSTEVLQWGVCLECRWGDHY